MTFYELHQHYYHALETEQLLLRPFSIEDAEAMFAYTSQPKSFRFLRGDAHRTIDETRQFLEKKVAACEGHSDFIWGICLKKSNTLIGTCRLFNLHLTDLRGEVSYLIAPTVQGCGIASEAVGRVIQYAFEELGLMRVQARCVVNNFGSERVMQKCGMQLEGVLRRSAYIHGAFHDYKLYAIIRDAEV